MQLLETLSYYFLVYGFLLIVIVTILDFTTIFLFKNRKIIFPSMATLNPPIVGSLLFCWMGGGMIIGGWYELASGASPFKQIIVCAFSVVTGVCLVLLWFPVLNSITISPEGLRVRNVFSGVRNYDWDEILCFALQFDAHPRSQKWKRRLSLFCIFKENLQKPNARIDGITNYSQNELCDMLNQYKNDRLQSIKS